MRRACAWSLLCALAGVSACVDLTRPGAHAADGGADTQSARDAVVIGDQGATLDAPAGAFDAPAVLDGPRPPDAPAPALDGPTSIDAPTRRANGTACDVAAECTSGLCVDGVCCATSCTEACKACDLQGALGQCSDVAAGIADPLCAAELPSTCGRDGTCDGRGACRKHGSGTECAAASCSANTERAASTCNGAGTCVAGAARTCPSGFVCGTSQCIANGTPVVNAGPDQTSYTVAARVALAGSATDDGLPNPLQYTWTKVSGPGVATFESAAALATGVRFSAAGPYVLRLTASDGAGAGQDDVSVLVLALDVGLVGHYRLDEGSGPTTADASGGGNTGTLVAGAAWGTGRLGGALDVRGGDGDSVRVEDPADGRLDFGTSDFTLCVWMNTTQIAASGFFPEVVTKLESASMSSRNGYEIFLTASGKTTFKIWSAPGAVGTATSGLIDGAWHHVCGRKTATQVEIFADGTLRSAAAHALGSISNAGPLVLGNYAGVTWADYDGLLDDVRVYARALSNAEIAGLAAGRP